MGACPVLRYGADAQGCLMMLRGIVQRHGVPDGPHSDSHGIFQRSKSPNASQEQLRGQRDPTQFARAPQELGYQSRLGAHRAGQWGHRADRREMGHLGGRLDWLAPALYRVPA